MQPTTKNTEQEIANKSYDSTFDLEMVELVGYDSGNNAMRPLAVTNTGLLRITI